MKYHVILCSCSNAVVTASNKRIKCPYCPKMHRVSNIIKSFESASQAGEFMRRYNKARKITCA